MSIEDRLGTLPRPGPFRVKGSFVPQQLLKGFLWFLLFGGLGGGFGFYGVYLISQLLETTHIWTHGTQAYPLGYRGKVRTTNFIFKNYDLKVHYRTMEGNPHVKRVEFFRFFSGPGKGDRYSVRYLTQQPKKATFSWAYEARYHGWFFAILMIVVAGLFLFGLYAICSQYWRDVFLVKRLARKGYLVPASILEVQSLDNPQTGKVEYLYHFSYQRERTYEGEYKATDGTEHPLLFDHGKNLVLLAAQTGQEHRVLRHDGYPLVL